MPTSCDQCPRPCSRPRIVAPAYHSLYCSHLACCVGSVDLSGKARVRGFTRIRGTLVLQGGALLRVPRRLYYPNRQQIVILVGPCRNSGFGLAILDPRPFNCPHALWGQDPPCTEAIVFFWCSAETGVAGLGGFSSVAPFLSFVSVCRILYCWASLNRWDARDSNPPSWEEQTHSKECTSCCLASIRYTVSATQYRPHH